MKANLRRPRWIVLGLALLGFIGLLAIEHGLAISAAGHRVVLVAVVLFFYALVALWLKANSVAIMMEDWGGPCLTRATRTQAPTNRAGRIPTAVTVRRWPGLARGSGRRPLNR